MAGGIVMAIVLLLFPVLLAIGGLIVAIALGTLLHTDARQRFQGSELLDLNR
jgi:hypothetical protein